MSVEEAPPQAKVEEYPKKCSTCMHVRTCKAFAMAVGMNKSFNESNDFVNLLQSRTHCIRMCRILIPNPKIGLWGVNLFFSKQIK
jgi:hypothetical protein